MSSDVGTFDYCIVGGGIVGTYMARSLVSRGHTVALVERGSREFTKLRPAAPAIANAQRHHGGLTNARHHVLGGNSHVWGGGLMRAPRATVGGVLGLDLAVGIDEDLTADFDEVERMLGLRHALGRRPLVPPVDGVGYCDVAEIGVLPGRARNVAREALDILATSTRCRIYCDVRKLRFLRAAGSARVEAVAFESDAVTHRLGAKTVIIAAGAIDSNLLVARDLQPLFALTMGTVGGSVHDHFSVPMFTMRPKEASKFLESIALLFREGMIVGRHFEMAASRGWGARGFLHFQFLFDGVSPYREIKDVLALRQQRAGLTRSIAAITRMVGQLPRLARIGYSRFVEQRLHVSRAVPVVATLDFETFPSPENRFVGAAGDSPKLHWDIRPEDVVAFHALAAQCGRLVSFLADRDGAIAEPHADYSTPSSAEAHLRKSATDAYHLGGGLRAGHGVEGGIVDLDLRLQGTDNVYVISAAVFRRPGVANPTLALLALANRFIRRQTR